MDSDNKWKDFIAGGVAGMVARTVTSPIDVIKIRLQVQESKENISLKQVTRDLMKSGNGIKAFWKGNTAGILLYASYNSIQFSTFDFLQKRSDYNFGSFASGGVSALVATSLTYPFDLLRTRMTISSNKGLLNEIKSVVNGSEGFKGLFKGYTLTIGQVVPYMGCIFATHKFLSTKMGLSDFTSGAAAGFICKTIFMPADMFRRRLQLFKTHPDQFKMIPESRLEYTYKSRNRLDLLEMMWKKEGLRAFFRGWSMAVIKSTPVTAITFSIHKAVCEFLSPQ